MSSLKLIGANNDGILKPQAKNDFERIRCAGFKRSSANQNVYSFKGKEK